MPITTSFAYSPRIITPPQIKAPPPPPPPILGPLQGFVGPGDAGKPRVWTGTGFNMIWRPNFGGASGPKDFFLELNCTSETLEFTEISGAIPNRGFLQADIELKGVSYLQQISDSFLKSGQHFEPGIWANVPLTTNPNEPSTVVRMGSIPHGTTINAQGTGINVPGANPTPQFATASITPFVIGQPGNLVHFPEEILTNASISRTPIADVPCLNQARLTNPNLFLSEAIAGQKFDKMTVLQVSTLTSAKTIPTTGGGTDSIAFLVGTAGGPNANAIEVDATFWLEEIAPSPGHPIYSQLQYTQRVLLNFNGLSWPHITVATLTSPGPLF